MIYGSMKVSFTEMLLLIDIRDGSAAPRPAIMSMWF